MVIERDCSCCNIELCFRFVNGLPLALKETHMKNEYTREDKIKYYEGKLERCLDELAVKDISIYKKFYYLEQAQWLANRIKRLFAK